MSWSLRISDGDFVASQGALDVVRGEPKLVQDLRNHILEELGTDPYHPTYGSSLEQNPDIVGSTFQISTLEIDIELRRIVNEYQRRQVERARNDQAVRGKISLDRGEVLVSLQSITFEQKEDRLTVTMSITTGSEESFSFSIEI